jgi:AAA+ ATPase superfamily predicted ATPase
MNKFINRKKELKLLDNLYVHEGSDLAIIYGRRRLGKTALLKAFASNRHHCYFMASLAGEKLQINALGNALATTLAEPLFEEIDFNNWDELFGLFDRIVPSDKKFIFIIDEFQYLCKVQPAFSSIIQKWWDEKWSHSNILLILCGSITSMMYKETLATSAPLYGRSSLQLLLAPIKYQYLPEFIPHITKTQKLVEFYAICGGTPRYIELLQNYKNYKKALAELVLDRNSILYNEAKYILHEELSSPNVCWSILHAIGSGKTKISELGQKLSLPANQLTRYLDLLKDLFLIYREVPVLEKNPAKSKKGIYLISEPFIRLWFSCIYPYESFLEFDEKELIIDKLQLLIDQHIAYCFEDLCRHYVKYKMLNYDCLKIGRQWGSHYEIDIAGVNSENQLTLLGECKWSKKKMGISLLLELKKKIIDNKLPVATNCKYLFFSKAGFSDDLIDLSNQKEEIILINSLL